MTRVVAIVQARLGSSRLPRKVLADIGDRPLLLHVLERVWAMPGVDVVALALPHAERDAWRKVLEGEADIARGESPAPNSLTARFASRHPDGFVLPIFFGPTDDVLSRFCIAVAGTDADVVIRVTADCPLWDPGIGHLVLDQALANGYDFATNDVTRSGYPDGTDVQIVTRELLVRAGREATASYDREHVCPWMARHAERFHLERYGYDASDLKVSVDTEEDLARVRAIYAALDQSDLSLHATIEAAERAGVWTPPWRGKTAS